MKINSFNQTNNLYKTPSFGIVKDGHEKHLKCWSNAYEKTSDIRTYGTASLLLGLLLCSPSQIRHSAKWSKMGKCGAGLIILSTLTMLYESYKMGKIYNEEKKKLD